MDLSTDRSRLRMFFLIILNEGLDWKLASILIHDLAELGKNYSCISLYYTIFHDGDENCSYQTITTYPGKIFLKMSCCLEFYKTALDAWTISYQSGFPNLIHHIVCFY